MLGQGDTEGKEKGGVFLCVDNEKSGQKTVSSGLKGKSFKMDLSREKKN